MSKSQWLSVPSVAALIGTSRQGIGKAVRVGHWRGAPLDVRLTHGRGGRSGVSYQVSLASLEAALEGRSTAAQTAFEAANLEPRRNASNQDARIIGRLNLVLPVLDHPERSAERAAAIQAAADRAGVSLRTVERWTADYERSGVAGLGRRKPSNAGKRRTFVSVPFDRAFRAAGYPDADLSRIGAEIEKALKGLWASRSEIAGWAEVRRLAEFLLLEACEAGGFALPPSALRLSRRHVERFAEYRIVNVMRNDRKRYDDNKPRIRRDWTGLAPMERVVADVHPIDVVVTRPDGSPAWPKLIGFMDAGTGRLFYHMVLLPKGEGIRQEHVTEAFLAMAAHPDWGFPRGLYLDNGSEFAHLSKLQAALDLISEGEGRTVIFARPYNASAKPIENLFGRLERYVFSSLPGYAGGNRMAKKTQAVGRPTQPYPGSWEAFCDQVALLIRGFNARPVGGQWGDRSPQDWFAEKVAAGWRPASVNPHVLDSLFSDRDTRRVEKGGVLNIGGQRWEHPALAEFAARSVVAIALPWRRGEAPLFQNRDGGWLYLNPEIVLPALWTEGAEESARRQKAHNRQTRALAKAAGDIDAAAIAGRLAERAHQVRAPRPDMEIDAGAELTALAVAKAAPAPAPQLMSPEEARRIARDRETARLERLEKLRVA